MPLNTDGLVAMTKEECAAMPCAPRDFHIIPWLFIGTFQRGEREEAAARILAYSQQLDSWVGVPWTKLVEMMQDDFETRKRASEITAQNWEEAERVARLQKKWWWKTGLSLSIYAWFVKKPAAARPKETPHVPHSFIFLYGAEFVVEGIHELVDRKLLELRQVGEDSVFFPTPAMIQRILEVQRQPYGTAA